MKTCIYCGNELKEDAVFCSACGREQSEKTTTADTKAQVKVQNRFASMLSAVKQALAKAINWLKKEKQGNKRIFVLYILIIGIFVLSLSGFIIALKTQSNLNHYFSDIEYIPSYEEDSFAGESETYEKWKITGGTECTNVATFPPRADARARCITGSIVWFKSVGAVVDVEYRTDGFNAIGAGYPDPSATVQITQISGNTAVGVGEAVQSTMEGKRTYPVTVYFEAVE